MFTVAVGFGTFVSYAALMARSKERRGGSNGSKRGSRGKNRGRRNKGKGAGTGGGLGRDPGRDDAGGDDEELPDEVPGATADLPKRERPEPSLVRSDSGAVRVGRLTVGPGILGYGSCGTIVFEGELDGRPVAVKRLLAQFHELARAERDADFVG